MISRISVKEAYKYGILKGFQTYANPSSSWKPFVAIERIAHGEYQETYDIIFENGTRCGMYTTNGVSVNSDELLKAMRAAGGAAELPRIAQEEN